MFLFLVVLFFDCFYFWLEHEIFIVFELLELIEQHCRLVQSLFDFLCSSQSYPLNVIDLILFDDAFVAELAIESLNEIF